MRPQIVNYNVNQKIIQINPSIKNQRIAVKQKPKIHESIKVYGTFQDGRITQEVKLI